MGNGKHHTNGKHLSKFQDNKLKDNNYRKKLDTSNTQAQKKNAPKIILYTFIILAIVVAGVLLYNHYNINEDITSSDNNNENLPEVYYDPTKTANIKETLTVNGADYLEVSGLYINNDNPNLSTVSAKLKNISDKSYKNVCLRITLLDKENKIITAVDYKIDTISPNEYASTYAAIKQDLSKCENYAISLKKN